MSLRAIPSIEQLRRRPGIQALVARHGHDVVVEALGAEAAEWRTRLRAAGESLDRETVATAIEVGASRRVSERTRPSLRPVINATGVIIHTNLGRAPLAAAAVERIDALARGYTNLEYDLRAGRRGARDSHAEMLVTTITGAEAAVVVNNCAAATLLVLAALARGREVLVSRAELVEIGGGFRVPDVMAQSGARLREVGTTNRTRAADYALAIGESTGAILRVHPSNFRIEGFVERTPLGSLVELGRRFAVPVVEDLGSGLLDEHTEGTALSGETTVQTSVRAGTDVVCFSGDKLLGGPQAGVIVGRNEHVARVRRHPLMRALRVDKLTYAALEATLGEYLVGRARESVPVLQMARLTVEEIEPRAQTLARRLLEAGWDVRVVDGVSTIGGGSAPGSGLPTRLVAIAREGLTADALEERLRQLDPPIVARIEHERVVLDLRTVRPEEDGRVTELLLTIG
jgi:L-seryl-tRNA(Ser) seleniumtransferase